MTARVLALLRHAKADAPPGVADIDRPLSIQGHADAHVAGAWLRGQLAPELVICSPAKRARQTWSGVAPSLGRDEPPRVRYEPRVYERRDLLELVREIDDQVGAVLLVGHNPAISHLGFALDPRDQLDPDGLRPCGLAIFSISGGWRDCGPDSARLTAAHTARGG